MMLNTSKMNDNRLPVSLGALPLAPFGAPLMVLLLLVAPGCGGRAGGESTLPTVAGADGFQSAQEYNAALREFYATEPGARLREALRARLHAHVGLAAAPLIAADDYEAVVEQLASMAELYTPEELATVPLSASIEGPARYVLQAGSSRGDEGRVLAALLLLTRLHPEDAELERRYRQISDWGQAARSQLPNDFERYSQLIQVWDVHALLSPDVTVIDTLAQLHIDRRDAATRVLRNPRSMMRMQGPPAQQVIGLAPLDVAGVYLRHGNLGAAIERLEAMGSGGPNAETFLRTLRVAQQSNEEGAEAMLQLAEFYRQARPEVARGLCILGRRRFVEDGRFPACLARVAGDRARYALATAWYAEAIERAPTVRLLYDEALAQLNQFIQEGLFSGDPSEARALAHYAERILRARAERWPDSPPPVPEEHFLFLLGVLEMNAGNPADARTRFEASVNLRPMPEALLQLGQVLERTGAPELAVRRYREALDMTQVTDPGGASRRAELLEHMGNGFRATGNTQQANRMYRQALDIWAEAAALIAQPPEGAAEMMSARGVGMVDVRRGILLDKLGRRDEAREAFRRVLSTSGNNREVFATMLSHLAVGSPEPALATDVFREAQRQLSLDPEWKVYFGLWLRLVAARAGEQAASQPADAIFTQFSQAGAWAGQLARFGAGTASYEQLLEAAADRGQRTEAHFYEAARRLAVGDADGARTLLDSVIEGGMVSFFEYIMAQELMRVGELSAAGPQARATDVAAPAVP